MGALRDDSMKKDRLIERIDQHRRTIHLVAVPLLLGLMFSVYLLVYATGGIKFVYSHTMYLVILSSGFLLGSRGGLLLGFLAGIVLGPMMPIDVHSGEMQQASNWLYRLGVFSLVGFLSGFASDQAIAYQARLRWLFEHNSSTKLQNRNALFDRLLELRSTTQSSNAYILVVVSFENAMELKSAFGFAVIEEVTLKLAKRFDYLCTRFESNHIGKHIYHTDTAQISILLNMEVRRIDTLLAELTEASREHILYNQVPIHIDMRMGYVTFSEVVESPEVYLHRAEAALTVAYAKVRDSVAYSLEIMTATEENLSLLGELKDAIKNGQLSMHYQAKIDIATGQTVGVEALMRWQHPKRGNIPPGVFIPRAEQSTLIELITEFALEQAIAQIAAWQKGGLYISIAVNISTRNLLQPGFTEYILGLLEQHGISGEWLELEVTEGALMMDMERTINELRRLADLKIIISIDDFGTGYSSLQYLHQLPISLLKIDQSFVSRLPSDKGAAYILEAAVMLAHNMGIKAIAEGVENAEIYEFLRDIGCDLAQGFLISKPLPAAEFLKWHSACHGCYESGVKITNDALIP